MTSTYASSAVLHLAPPPNKRLVAVASLPRTHRPTAAAPAQPLRYGALAIIPRVLQLPLLSAIVASCTATDLPKTESIPAAQNWRGAVGEERAREIEATWPRSLDEAVERLVSVMSDEHKALVRDCERDRLIMFHHGWGTGIRNSFGLWRGNNDLLTSACGEPCLPDDASMEIIYATWERLHEEAP